MRLRHKFLLTGFALLVGGAWGAGPVSAQEAEQADTGSLEEVTVTARRRAESLQKVPVSISAFTSNQIERRAVTSIVDIGRIVPNMVSFQNVGLPTATGFFLRGVGQDESISTSDPAVATYIDGIYVARQVANNSYLYDIERIEVLRGPQGTLYGRNTSGGAIRIITRKPDEEMRMNLAGSYGNYDRWDLKASASGPLSDKIFASLAAFTAQQDKGFSFNSTLNERSWTRDSTGVRGQIRFVPNENLDIMISAEYVKETPTPPLPTNAVGGAFTDDYFTVVSGEPGNEQNLESQAYTMNIEWQVGEVSVTSITGYRELDQAFRNDISDLPVPAWILDTDATFKQWSQEIQATGTLFNERLDWVFGLFYMDENNDMTIIDEVFLPPFLVLNFNKTLENDAKSFAAFAQFNFRITDDLSLTAGGRWTREKKTIEVNQMFGIPGFPEFGLFPLFGTQEVIDAGGDVAPVFKEFNPKVGLEYQFTDDIMAYVSFTQGFKSGGWNARVFNQFEFLNIEPESVDSYEIGIKSEWFDNKLRLNLTYFYADYDNFIITAVSPITGNFITINAAKAAIDGLELDFVARPVQGFDVYGFVGLMWNRYKELDPGVVFSIDNEIKRTPDFTFQIGFTYTHPVSDNGNLIWNTDFSYKAKLFNGVSNTPFEAAPSQEILNASLSYEFIDQGVTVSVACRNCLDDEYFLSTLDFSVFGFATQYPGEPRTYFVSAKWNFGD